MIWKPKIIYYCGGGFKVFSVTGVLPLLKKFGLLDDVHTYAGTSAGGLMAFLCVINYTPEEIFNILYDMDFTFYEKHISFTRLLNNESLLDSTYIIELIEKLLNHKNIDKDITLSDLCQKMNKDLVVFGAYEETGKEIKIDKYSFPNEKVKDIIYQTMTIPILLESKLLNNKKVIDGGLVARYALWHFPLEQTLGIRYYNDKTEINKFKYNPSIFNNITSNFNKILKMLNQLMDALEYEKLKDKQIYEIYIYTYNVDTFTFDLTPELKKQLFISGIEATKKFIKNPFPQYYSCN